VNVGPFLPDEQVMADTIFAALNKHYLPKNMPEDKMVLLSNHELYFYLYDESEFYTLNTRNSKRFFSYVFGTIYNSSNNERITFLLATNHDNSFSKEVAGFIKDFKTKTIAQNLKYLYFMQAQQKAIKDIVLINKEKMGASQ